MAEKHIKTVKSTKPIRMWIDGKCFNIKKYDGQQRNDRRSRTTGSGKDKSEESADKECGLEISNIDIADDGKLSTSFELPMLYYTKLKHNEFFNLNSLTYQTNTNIQIPSYGKPGKLMISGGDENNIREALNEIHAVIGQIRIRSLPSHFIAIPLVNEEIKTNFENFKNEILKDSNIRGMDASIFQSPLKLHLTIDVFVLLSEREKKEAVQALEEYNETILKPLIEKCGPLKINVSGIECMNEDYAHVDVLYAKAKIINETDEVNLQGIANKLSEHFYERGLLKRHSANVKLHMTLIHTKYREESGKPRKRFAKRKNFDASTIMEKFKEYEFGQCDFNTVHISIMSTVGEDGFYENLTSIKV